MKTLAFALSLLPALAQAGETLSCRTEISLMGEPKASFVEIDYGSPGSVSVDGNRQEFLARTEGKIEGVPAYLEAVSACSLAATAKRNLCAAIADEAARQECVNTVDREELECGAGPAEGLMGADDGREDPLLRMAKLGVVFLKLYRDSAPEDRFVEIRADLTKIAFVKGYQLGKSTRFGTPGLFEYFAADGSLVGRYLMITPFVIPCE